MKNISKLWDVLKKIQLNQYYHRYHEMAWSCKLQPRSEAHRNNSSVTDLRSPSILCSGMTERLVMASEGKTPSSTSVDGSHDLLNDWGDESDSGRSTIRHTQQPLPLIGTPGPKPGNDHKRGGAMLLAERLKWISYVDHILFTVIFLWLFS